MCLAIPGKVVELLEGTGRRLAMVDLVGVTREVDIGLLDDAPPDVGDWVLVHVGFAMARLDQAEAQETLSMLRMMQDALADPEEQAVAAGHTEEQAVAAGHTEQQAVAAAHREGLLDDVRLG